MIFFKERFMQNFDFGNSKLSYPCHLKIRQESYHYLKCSYLTCHTLLVPFILVHVPLPPVYEHTYDYGTDMITGTKGMNVVGMSDMSTGIKVQVQIHVYVSTFSLIPVRTSHVPVHTLYRTTRFERTCHDFSKREISILSFCLFIIILVSCSTLFKTCGFSW